MRTDLREMVNFHRKSELPEALTQKICIWIEESVSHWRARRLLRQNESDDFAIVVKVAGTDVDLRKLVDTPNQLFDLAYLHHRSGDVIRYAANALRKMRATARTGTDTIDLAPDAFVNAVASAEDDGTCQWGEFPYGGAALVRDDVVQVLVGVSAFRPEEDHWLAESLAKFIRMVLALERAAAAKS